MSDTVLGLLFIILAVLTVVGVDRSLRAQFVRSTKARWEHEGYTIQWSLDNCPCYGTRPESTAIYRDIVFGVLAVADGTVLFKGRLTANCNTKIPIDEVYGLGLCTIRFRIGKSSPYQIGNVIEIHTVEWGEWQVYIFKVDEAARAALCNAIQSQRAYSIPERNTGRQMTPTHAKLMTQDVYGEWHEEDSGDLYLAPDRIVFDWKSLVCFADIYHISILKHSGLLGQDLVRIESNQGVIGLLMRGANQWVTMVHPAGRKKKESE